MAYLRGFFIIYFFARVLIYFIYVASIQKEFDMRG